MQFTIRHFENNGKKVVMKNEVLSAHKIKSFGIVHDVAYRKDGGFKKFVKRGFVQTDEHVYIGVILSQVKAIKEAFKGRLAVNRQTIAAQKETRYGKSERKAINWEYKIVSGA